MRDRLIELLTKGQPPFNPLNDVCTEKLADYLLANGVIVLKNKPIGVMKDDNPYNSDVYCPYCGANLSGYYGEDSIQIIQCYDCGEYLDGTKAITREEAEQALRKEDEGK